jgi:tRNA dimethylallyltransferase
LFVECLRATAGRPNPNNGTDTTSACGGKAREEERDDTRRDDQGIRRTEDFRWALSVTTTLEPGVLVLGGPTASGKTSFAIALALRYGAEIVGADSRQIYRDMPVGTAAPTAEQQARVAHHLIGFLDPYERYSAARFAADAMSAVAAIHAKEKRAIVAGGTGFYLRALCGEVALAAEPDPALRERVRLEARTHPPDVLHAWLEARAPARAALISARDPYRIVRALEVDLARERRGARAPSAPRSGPSLRTAGLAYVKLGLRVDPVDLAARIARRTDAMLAGGLLEEAERVGPSAVAADAVGYREALAYLDGRLTFEELRTVLTRATRRYAKRQLTWFRAEPGLSWIDADDLAAVDGAVSGIGWTPAPLGQ